MSQEHEFSQKHGFDKTLLMAVIILVSIGIIMVFSSSGVQSKEVFNNPFHYLIHQLVGAVLGFGLIFLLIRIRTPLYLSLIHI